ncbi:hypothetical protein LMG26846_05154 [Achromobacter insuavis]|nr:hypothetical protein LMG26846_05154 [Achromobacter insuavis]
MPGQKPVVGVTNGVPVVNIAPPSAGGVSNNRYTQFNVGPSGVVLNNSGGASQTQLAGQVAGNPMLGNRHAGAILNQVTAPNPSQLLGPLEVAGNRANIIVANPAGITCNGCGFLNADRATLTTGKPRVGPDGGIGFDVAGGRLGIEGQGLNGMNLSQVDLIARTLEINADVWANRLNVTAGASRVDYATGAVSVQAGDGPAPTVALDTAALGGMYANSIRLIGTEAGVGVNIGGNLAALTGDLQVNAAGDVRIAPRATVQAAGDLRVQSGGDLDVQGAAQATGAVTLAAAGDVTVPGAVGAGALLSMDAGRDAAVGAQGSLRTLGALHVASGRDLSLSGSLLMSGQDARMQSGRHLTAAGQAAVPQPAQEGISDSGFGAAAQAGAESGKPSDPAASDDPRGGISLEGGAVFAKDGVTLQAGRDLVLPQQVVASGKLLALAEGNLALEAGTQWQSAGNVTIRAGQDATLGGAVLTDAALSLTSGNDLVQRSTGKLQGKRVQATSGRDLALRGALVSTADSQARAGSSLMAAGGMTSLADLILESAGNQHLAGQHFAAGDLTIQAAGDLTVDGTVLADAGALKATSGGAMTLGSTSALQAGGSLEVRASGALMANGTISGRRNVTLKAGTNAALNGKTVANGTLRIDASDDLAVGEAGLAQGSAKLLLGAGQDLRIAGIAGTAKGAGVGAGPGTLQAQAGRDLFITGAATAGSPIILGAQRDIRIDGIATALEGGLTADSGANLCVGAAGRMQATESLAARAGADLDADGVITAGAGLTLAASGDVRVGGLAAALGARAAGDASITAGRDVVVQQNGLFQAAGTLTAGAQRDLFVTGSLSSVGDMLLAAERVARVEGTAATDAILTLTGRDVAVGISGLAQAGRTLNASASGGLEVAGRLQSGAVLDLSAGGALGNTGIASAAGRASLKAGTTLDNTGSVLAGGGLIATATGQLVNAGQFVAGVGTDGALNLPGSLTLTAGSIVHWGVSLAGGALSLSADRLDLTDGKLSAVAKVTLATPGDVDSRNAVVQGGTLHVTAANLRNQSGELAATSDAAIKLAGNLDNTGGRISAAGAAGIEAAAIANRHGTLAGRDLTLTATSTPVLTTAVDNREGLIQADSALTLRAVSLDNSSTLTAAGEPPKGVLGEVVDVLAERVGNQAGAIRAHENLTLTTENLDNTGGEIVSQGNARILADELDNAGGKLSTGNSLAVIAKVLQGLGTLQSAGDLSFRYTGSLNQEGDIVSGRDLTLSVGGAMDNRAKVSAVGDLSITADSLNNQAPGELLAGGANAITVARSLTNAGLIDGGSTRITADRVENTGRIYGDTLSIQAGTLANSAGGRGGAVIASRGDMNIAVESLTNRDHALIYSGADLRIGGALDTQGAAIDQAASLLNASATIEAVGNARIAAAQIQNQNPHYTSGTVKVAEQKKVYAKPWNSSVMYDMADNWVCDSVTKLCGQDPRSFMDDDAERMLLLPSDQYPASRYGPQFDYTPGIRNKHGHIPVTPIQVPKLDRCALKGSGPGCSGSVGLWGGGMFARLPPSYAYGVDAKIWQVFGVTPPAGPTPQWTPRHCGRDVQCMADEHARREIYKQAFAAYQAPFEELNTRINAFNADFQRRLVDDFTYYYLDETVTETQTLTSDPGKILAGGAMTLAGTVINDKSQIAAGGALSVQGPAIQNIGAGGVRITTREGTQTHTYPGRKNHRKEDRSPYRRTASEEPIEVPVGAAGGDTAVSLSGKTPGASGIPAPRPLQVVSVNLPGGNTVRIVANPAPMPDSQLFAVNGKPDAPYIVVTDPRFMGPRPSLSSDYLLDLLRPPGALPDSAIDTVMTDKGPSDARLADWDALFPPSAGFLTPTGQPRRLGDGFYEQKLVSDQILASSGQRLLENYSDYDAQYKALMAEGARFAQRNGLKVGVALSEAQQRLLTTDLVWLEEELITLADGSTESVLVPRVYLLVRPDDLKGDGTLMTGRNVNLMAQGDIANSGTLGAREAIVMSAANIVNQAGGRIQGGRIDLTAREDLANQVSTIVGKTVALLAGRDIRLTSTTATENHGATWGSYLTGISRIDAGSLNMRAGRDLALTAAQLAVQDDARLQAGRDLSLTALTQSHGETNVRDARNRYEFRRSEQAGTTIAAGGNLALVAGQDVIARAADVTAGKQLAVDAGRDIQITAGERTLYAYTESHHKERGFLRSKSTHKIQSVDQILAQAATFTGDTAVLSAGRGLSVAGSNVGAQRDLLIVGKRDVNILPGENSSDRYDYKMVRKSGLGAMGGLSYGTRRQTDSLDGRKTFHTASTVGSVEGDTLIRAGQSLNVVGSNVLARQGDVTLIGKKVNIGAAQDTGREREFHEIKQSGLTLTVSNPIVSALQTGARMAEASGKTDNAVMKGLAGATAGLAAVNAYDAVRTASKAADAAELAKPGSSNPIDKAGGVSIKLSLGASKSSSTTDRSTVTAFASTVAAGRDLTIIAQGAGKDSDIDLIGSNLSAGNNAILKADGDILLQAARNAVEQKTVSKSSNASIGIGYSTGGQQNGFTLELGASLGRGKAESKDESWTNSQVTAGNVLALRSGGDTTLKGATGQASQVVASVGGDLLLESLQDSSKYASGNKSAGFGVSLCIPPYCAGSSSVSANASVGKINSGFKSVTEQTGLRAGDGGFQIDVQHNTKLIGSVIAGSDRAIADGLNQLGTGTLVTKDISNRATYSGSQVSIGGGFGFGGGKSADAGLGTSKDGDVAGGAGKQHGTSIATDDSGFGMGTPVVVAARGSDGSTTQSAISGGSVVIRDEAAQQDLTGLTATQTIAALNRDTSSDTLNALKPIFDKEKIEAGFEIASEAQKQVGQFLETRARQAKALEDALKNEPEGPRRDQLKQAFEDAKTWGPGGESRRWLTAIMGAVSGNVTGAAGDAVKAVAVNYLQGLGATEVKKLVAQMEPGPKGEAARAALHAIVGCAGAAGKGSDCGAGALGAGSGAVLNALLAGDASKMTPEEKEVRRNLIGSLVAGIAETSGVSGAEAVFAATNETENNYLKPDELKLYLAARQALKDCAGDVCVQARKEVDRLNAISVNRNNGAERACLENPDACAAVAQVLRADITALEAQANSLDRTEAAAAANNLLQARTQYYTNLESRAQAAEQARESAGQGSWLGALSKEDLSASGYLTPQEVQDLEAMRSQGLKVGGLAVLPAVADGAVRGIGSFWGRRSIQSIAEEAKASALSSAKGAANAKNAGAATEAGTTTFKTAHYASRLEAEGVNVAIAEARVTETVNAMRSNMVTGTDVRGRMTVNGVLVEYRATLLPSGKVNVGTIFPVRQP